MIVWDDISTVLIDMDGTLLDLNFDNQFWQELIPMRFAEQNLIDLESARRLLKPRFKAMEGKLEWYCLDYWTAELGLDIVGLKKQISTLIDILPDAEEFLIAVRNVGKRLVLLTNAHPTTLEIKMRKIDITPYFDQIISSHELGVPKEDALFWPRLKQIEPFDCSSTLMIDDSISVLRAACEYGIDKLIAVSKPDSTRQSIDVKEFDAVKSLREIMP